MKMDSTEPGSTPHKTSHVILRFQLPGHSLAVSILMASPDDPGFICGLEFFDDAPRFSPPRAGGTG